MTGGLPPSNVGQAHLGNGTSPVAHGPIGGGPTTVHIYITIFGFRKMQGCLVAKYISGGYVVFAIVMCLVCHGCNFWVDSCCSHFNTILSKSYSLAKFLFSFYIKSFFSLYNVRHKEKGK